MNEEHSQAKNRAALVSLLAACLLTAIKLVVGVYTNSLGILSEALHSGLDLLAAAMTLYAVRLSSRPADARHPYGHGKVENLSALGETVLLFVICIWVVYEGAGRLLSGDTPVAPSIWGIIVMGISIVIDVNRVRVLKKVAKETRSQALEADALHFSTDILSSAVVLVGVAAVWLAAKLPGQSAYGPGSHQHAHGQRFHGRAAGHLRSSEAFAGRPGRTACAFAFQRPALFRGFDRGGRSRHTGQ